MQTDMGVLLTATPEGRIDTATCLKCRWAWASPDAALSHFAVRATLHLMEVHRLRSHDAERYVLVRIRPPQPSIGPDARPRPPRSAAKTPLYELHPDQLAIP